MVIRIRWKYVLCTAIVIITVFMLAILYSNSQNDVDSITQEDGSVYIPIIMYHEIKYNKLGKDVISPYEFESDLKYLNQNNYTTVTMTELIDYVNNGAALPENPIILSFDDGYLSTYKYAYPLLKQYNMKIVFSIIGKNTDDFTRIPDDNIDYSHVTWDQLKEMMDSGYVEVQNHTYNLHSTCNGRTGCNQKWNESFSDYEQVLSDDINILQEELLNITGRTPNTFTYPYGLSNENTVTIIKKLGFQASLSCDYGINKITDDPECLYNLKRICRSHGDTIKKVIKDVLKTIR